MKHSKFYLVLLVIVVLTVMVGLTGCTDVESEVNNSEYCELVGVYLDSNGEYGWPDYLNKYDDFCDNTGE